MKNSCAYPMWGVVGDVREDVFGRIHAIEELIIR